MSAFGRVLELDRRYCINHHNGLQTSSHNYQVLLGQIPVLISAPHTVNHVRDGIIKRQDGITGGIAEYLCQKFRTYGVIRTWNHGDDPNYGQDVVSMAYRNQIVQLVQEHNIKWVFDLHGIMWHWKIDVNLGINDGYNLSCDDRIVRQFLRFWPEEFVVKVDEPYKAASPWTVSSYVHRKTGISCIQIELGPKARTEKLGFGEFYMGFERLISEIKK